MFSVLPPTLFLLLLAMIVAHLVVPVAGPGPLMVRLPGLLPLSVGLWGTVSWSRQFQRADTGIRTFDEPDHLVECGLFAHSRNPMYLGFLLALVGLALLLGTASTALGPLAFGVAAHRVYIPFEEARMSARFGPRYAAYRRRVGRWWGRRHPSRPPGADRR
jgi:protein-S-isoprenylcysteine O-methyltransferase Ste14